MLSVRRRTFEPFGIWRGKPAATSPVPFGPQGGLAVAFHRDWLAARRRFRLMLTGTGFMRVSVNKS